jgi:pimeloyl-ACP methyl ester carboxylesterase
MSHPAFAAIILAAGEGTRLKSAVPKVLHELAGWPLIRHVTEALRPLGPAETVIVIGQGMEAVARAWAAQALFSSQSEEVRELAHADRLRNQPVHLAAALRGIGAGAMDPLWDRLAELDGIPVTIIAGERDGRYAAIGRRLADALPGARLLLVPGAGHGLPREAPQAVAAAISSP